MKNQNLLFAFLLALPLFIVADAPMDAIEEVEDVSADVAEVIEEEEEVVVDEEVSASSSAPFVSDDVEEVVVTGSRIKKSTFSSIAPPRDMIFCASSSFSLDFFAIINECSTI